MLCVRRFLVSAQPFQNASELKWQTRAFSCIIHVPFFVQWWNRVRYTNSIKMLTKKTGQLARKVVIISNFFTYRHCTTFSGFFYFERWKLRHTLVNCFFMLRFIARWFFWFFRVFPFLPLGIFILQIFRCGLTGGLFRAYWSEGSVTINSIKINIHVSKYYTRFHDRRQTDGIA